LRHLLQWSSFRAEDRRSKILLRLPRKISL
jgi:hypothetical protein